MKNYIGAKIIKAEKVKFREYLKVKYGNEYEYPGVMPLDKEVYMVIYPHIGDEKKPYISMSPVEVFEKCYREVEPEETQIMLLSNPIEHPFRNE